ncbi:MAG: TIGR00730 family Rossman fold protein [Muribaculaceae bacterium]|nr:TIGR00730 family Rossman fold protein [Muribaculaceae bacterium]
MKVAVFCSSRADIDRMWIEAADILGNWIGAGGDTLVYGGVSSGLMEVVATATRSAGGRTVGVVPAKRASAENKYNTINIRVGSLCNRKETMMQLADVFVALPGGYGTLDEIVTTLTSIIFNRDSRRLIVLNADNVFEPLRLQYYAMIEHGLLEPALLKSVQFVKTIDEVIALLEQERAACSDPIP